MYCLVVVGGVAKSVKMHYVSGRVGHLLMVPYMSKPPYVSQFIWSVHGRVTGQIESPQHILRQTYML